MNWTIKHPLFFKVTLKYISQSLTPMGNHSYTIAQLSFVCNIFHRKFKKSKVAKSNKDSKDSLEKLLTLFLLWKSFSTKMLVDSSNGMLVKKVNFRTSHLVFKIKRWYFFGK